MSVRGEFRRSVGNYLEHLGAQGSAEAREVAGRLRGADALAEDDLNGAARRLLEELEAGAPSGGAPGDPALSEHLIAICRAVVGH